MAPGINLQNEVLLQHANSQVEILQDHKKQHQKDEIVEGLEVSTDDHTSISGKSPDNSIVNTEQQETVGPINEKISAITKALAEISKSITSIKENINEEAVESISDIQDKVYEKRETAKPRYATMSSDINYKKDKGGNYHMTLIYNSDSNDVRFSKDDDPVIVIKNDNIKNEGDFWRLVAKMREYCNQKKGYYFEDYLEDHGFMEKEKERIANIKKS